MKVIDAHVHLVQCIAGTGAGGEMRACGGGKGAYPDGTTYDLIPPELGSETVTPESVLALMDRNGVEKAVLLQGNFMGFQNLYSYEAMCRWPDRFLAAAAYDPFCRNRDGIVHRLFEELGIRVVKFEVSTGSGLMSNHSVFPLDGPLMEREYAMAERLGLVFVIDIGKLGSESCQVQALRRAILRHPGLKFVVCHLLAPKQTMEDAWSEALRALALPNVWFDLAALPNNLRPDEPPFPVTQRFIARAAQIAGADRLLYGSDLPSTLCRFSYGELLQCVTHNPALTPEQKQAILYENARRVFFGDSL